MGCICSKGAPRNKIKEKDSRKLSKRSVASLKRDEIVVEVDGSGNDATARLISAEPTDRSSGSTPTAWDVGEKKTGVFEKPTMPQMKRASIDSGGNGEQPQISRILGIRNGVDGAQVVAGWPSWLTAVAGEAIKGWTPRKADSFEKLDKIGQGTYSSVYRALDCETRKIVALKKVRFVNMDPESIRFMAREIIILRRLDHPNVMKLEGLVTSRVSGNLYLVFEYMEHDLAGLAASPAVKFTEAQIKCYMQQLLWGLEHCHNCGVLHRDIKGSNLLIDNNGILKIGDFGLATFYRTSHNQPLTSRVVTLWYRPPELLLGATDYGVAVDLWSAGCILTELFAGKPIMAGRTEVEQLHKVFKLCGSPSEDYWKKSKLPHATIFKPQQPYKRCVSEAFKDFPSSALKLLDTLLAVEPDNRGSTSSALHSEFFTTKPLPCDPSTLPKYSPSKEMDAKVRDEEARRQKADYGKRHDSYKKGPRSKAVPAPDANAELLTSIQKRQALNPKSCSESYNTEEDSGTGFPIDPSRGPLQNGFLDHHRSHADQSGSSLNKCVNEVGSLAGSQREFESIRNGMESSYGSHRPMGAAYLSRFSNSIGVDGSSRLDIGRETNFNGGYNQLKDPESSDHLLGRPNSSYKKDEKAPGGHSKLGYTSKQSRIHYSGPLIPAVSNIEEMLREHERQIQNAVRKARVDKTKNQKARSELGLTESLLHCGRDGQ